MLKLHIGRISISYKDNAKLEDIIMTDWLTIFVSSIITPIGIVIVVLDTIPLIWEALIKERDNKFSGVYVIIINIVLLVACPFVGTLFVGTSLSYIFVVSTVLLLTALGYNMFTYLEGKK